MTVQASKQQFERRIPYRNRITPDEAIAAIKSQKGLLSYAAKVLGCSRQSLQNMAARNPRVAKALHETREALTVQASKQQFKRRIPYRNRITPDEAIAAIKSQKGLLSYAAKVLGCSRQSLQNMAARNPRVAKALHETREALTDVAVAKLHELVEQGDLRAVTFWLSSRMGRERGFNPPMSMPIHEPANHNLMVVQNVIIEAVPSGTMLSARPAGRVLEGQLLEDNRTADDL